MHAHEMQQYILKDSLPNNSALNVIYEKVRGEKLPADWKAIHQKGDAPIFVSNKNDFFDPFKGTLTSIQQERVIPKQIRDSQDFAILFPHQELGTVYSNNVYSFTAKGNEVRVCLDGNNIVIQQKMGDHWLQYIPKSTFITHAQVKEVISSLGSRDLVNHCNAWVDVENPDKLLLFEKDSNQPKHEARMDKTQDEKGNQFNINSVTRISDGAVLGRPSQLFSNLESPQYVQKWYQGGDSVSS